MNTQESQEMNNMNSAMLNTVNNNGTLVMNDKFNDITYSLTTMFDYLGNTNELMRNNLKPLESINELDENNLSFYNGLKNTFKINCENQKDPDPEAFLTSLPEDDPRFLSLKEIVSIKFLQQNRSSKIDSIRKEAAAIAAMASQEELNKIKKRKVNDYFTDIDNDIQTIKRLMSVSQGKTFKNNRKKTSVNYESNYNSNHNRNFYSNNNEGLSMINEMERKNKKMALCKSVVSLSFVEGKFEDTPKNEIEFEEEEFEMFKPIESSNNNNAKELSIKKKVAFNNNKDSNVKVAKLSRISQSLDTKLKKRVVVNNETNCKRTETEDSIEDKRKKGKLLLDLKEINRQFSKEESLFTDKELEMLANLESCSDEDKLKLKKKLFLYYKKRLIKGISADVVLNKDDPDHVYIDIIKQFLYHNKTENFLSINKSISKNASNNNSTLKNGIHVNHLNNSNSYNNFHRNNTFGIFNTYQNINTNCLKQKITTENKTYSKDYNTNENDINTTNKSKLMNYFNSNLTPNIQTNKCSKQSRKNSRNSYINENDNPEISCLSKDDINNDFDNENNISKLFKYKHIKSSKSNNPSLGYGFGFGKSTNNILNNIKSNFNNLSNCNNSFNILPANKNPFYVDTPKSFYLNNQLWDFNMCDNNKDSINTNTQNTLNINDDEVTPIKYSNNDTGIYKTNTINNNNINYNNQNNSINLSNNANSNYHSYANINPTVNLYNNTIEEEPSQQTEIVNNINYNEEARLIKEAEDNFNVDLFLKKSLTNCNYSNKEIAEYTYHKYCNKNSSYLRFNKHKVEFTEKDFSSINDIKSLHKAHINFKNFKMQKYCEFEKINHLAPFLNSNDKKENSKDKPKTEDKRKDNENYNNKINESDYHRNRFLKDINNSGSNEGYNERNDFSQLLNGNTLKYFIKTTKINNNSYNNNNSSYINNYNSYNNFNNKNKNIDTNLSVINNIKSLNSISITNNNGSNNKKVSSKEKLQDLYLDNKLKGQIFDNNSNNSYTNINNNINNINDSFDLSFYNLSSSKKEIVNPKNLLNMNKIALTAKQEQLKNKLRMKFDL